MENIEKAVLKWHKETFSNATVHAITNKLDEEIGEYQRSQDIENMIEELADIAIVSITLLDRLGTSLSSEISRKLEINKKRVWGAETENGNRLRVK